MSLNVPAGAQGCWASFSSRPGKGPSSRLGMLSWPCSLSACGHFQLSPAARCHCPLPCASWAIAFHSHQLAHLQLSHLIKKKMHFYSVCHSKYFLLVLGVTASHLHYSNSSNFPSPTIAIPAWGILAFSALPTTELPCNPDWVFFPWGFFFFPGFFFPFCLSFPVHLCFKRWNRSHSSPRYPL